MPKDAEFQELSNDVHIGRARLGVRELRALKVYTIRPVLCRIRGDFQGLIVITHERQGILAKN